MKMLKNLGYPKNQPSNFVNVYDPEVRDYNFWSVTGAQYSMNVFPKQEKITLLLPSLESLSITFDEIDDFESRCRELDSDVELYYWIKHTVAATHYCWMSSFGCECSDPNTEH